jgi:glycerophosphoryl diester phosphodiesterase
MPNSHPILPDHRPLAIAHRGGNSLDEARAAIAYGADMLETDVWPYRGRLEVRHVKTIGPLPIYWEKWYIDSIGRRQMRLRELLDGVPAEVRLFLDLKGRNPDLGKRVIAAIAELQAEREIILCGRSWSQLDPIEVLPNVHVFYSVGEEQELANVWSRLERQQHPAVSIHHGLLTEATLARLNELGTTIVAWTVNDAEIAKSLFAHGVDGFTSDNAEMLARIVRLRERAFDESPAGDLPQKPEGASIVERFQQ